ncbi:PilN domain-containing protein [Candidatus Parcubacteria bacterium]|nr:PilN domain-containing protein [Candidatus Parcubacteria bacterium]
MINLLPPKNKKELLREEQYKIVLILGIFVLLFLVSLSLILFSIKIYVSSQLEVEKEFIERSRKAMEFSEIERLETKIRCLNKDILELELFYQNQISLIEILEELSFVLPSGVYLKTISINSSKEKDSKFLVSLSGFSPTRELLSEFKTNLEEKKELFKGKIDFPSATWTKPIDIDFSLNLKI